MNQMEIFKNPEFGSIRTFEQEKPGVWKHPHF